MAGRSTRELPIQKIQGTSASLRQDVLAVEEPLEIRLAWEADGRLNEKSLSITMRTPGPDFELAAGFLFSEGIILGSAQIADIHYADARQNVVIVTLIPDVAVDWKRLERHFYTTSSCGVCGKSSIAALQIHECPLPLKGRPVFSAATIHRLPRTLREAQEVFDSTGGLHAAALFNEQGEMLSLREDVGRHNAVDKLIGAALLETQVPLSDRLMLVSGRASFELMQKAVTAGIPILAAVGAPSSLAVEVAQDFDVTLLGFVCGDRFNIYSSPWRVREAASDKV